MENLSYLFVAYAIIFAAIFLYVMFIWRRQAHLDARLHSIELQLRALNDELAASSTALTRPAPL